MLRRVRPLWTAVITGVILALGTACAPMTPLGADGDMVNQWPAIDSPRQWKPVAETCYYRAEIALYNHDPAPCVNPHWFQSVHVGETTSIDPLPPVPGSEAHSAAMAECGTKAEGFLGGQWRDRRVRLTITWPGAVAWAGGARWFACLARPITLHAKPGYSLTVSLKGRLDQLEELRFGCFDLAADGAAQRRSCDEPHNAEYVGHFLLPDLTWEQLEAEQGIPGGRPSYQPCTPMIARFAGAPQVRTGLWVWPPSEMDWKAGDRLAHCFLWLDKAQASKSLKGVGPAGWPLK